MTIIGIAFVEIGLRNAVIGGEHHLGLEIEGGEPRPHRVRERFDIDRVVVIGRGDPQRGLPAHGFQRIEDLVADGRGRSRGILRIERHDENAVAALRLQRLEPLGDRRLPVAHRPVDFQLRTKPAQRLARAARFARG